MRIFEVIKISIESIRANKVRAVLTTLGIIIGISAVIALLSLGQGAQASILTQVQGLGSNSITILPSSGLGFQNRSSFESLLTNKLDYEIIKKLDNKVRFPEIEAVSPQTSKSLIITNRSKSTSASVLGVYRNYFEIRDTNINKGRFFTQNEIDNQRKVVVLGYEIAGKIFGENEPVGKTVKLGSTSFKVIGVADEKGGEFDNQAFVPFTTAAYNLVGNKDLSQIVVKVKDEKFIDATAIKIEDTLKDYYKISDDDKKSFSVFTSKDILSLTQTITGIFTTLLASIASISLIVGGIGIMNIMLVSVSERTKEIGLRKAVGAKENAILAQFLTEAVALTLIGGIIGIVLGLSLAFVLGSIGNIPVEISPQSILLATSVSAIIGIVFGFYPAYRAAKLNPIDALRYE